MTMNFLGFRASMTNRTIQKPQRSMKGTCKSAPAKHAKKCGGKMKNLTNGFYWFTWGAQAPDYSEKTTVWMPALVRDGYFLPLGIVESGEIEPSANPMRAWKSMNGTSPWQWGDEIRREV